jgi:LysM repeat protein
METVKTALVVVLLLAVLYGVFVVLNKPDQGQPPEVAWQTLATTPPQVEFGDSSAEPMAAFPPMVTAPPEMKPSIKPIEEDSEEPPAQVGGEDAANSAENQSTRTGNLEDPDTAIPIAPSRLAPDESPAFDSRAAAATEADLSPLVPEEASDAGSVSGLDEAAPSRRPSVYEQPAPGTPPRMDVAGNDRADSPSFDEAWQRATDQLNNQHWADALRTLSVFYDRPELVGRDRQRLVDLLDPLAGKVIYSTEHLLEPPYQVRPGETLLDIAEQHQVPAALLMNINGMTDAQSLTPGSVLKVVRGPFRAEIVLAKDELVLFLDDCYAGRFAVSIGNDPRPNPAEYSVVGKQEGREYFAPDGSRVPPLAPENPYGRWWIDLGGDVCIHASAQATPTHGGLGCISLDPNDAADVYGILSLGSKVLVR